jgi:putative CocE/NonD family hydrolase
MLGTVRVGDVDFGLDALIDLEGLQLRWLRRHLRGEQDAWRQRTPVRLFVMGENRWRDEDSWPVAGVDLAPLFLAGDGRLVWEQPVEAAPARYDFDPRRPVRTHGGAHLVLESRYPSGPVDHRLVPARDDVLVYEGAPLDEDLEVVGWVTAMLRTRSSAPSTDFTVKLLDVWPDGRRINIVDGIRRVRGADQPDGSGWVSVRVDLGATAILLRAGHALEVRVSSSNFPRFDINPNTGESAFDATDPVVAHQEVCVGGADASHVVLPIRRAR